MNVHARHSHRRVCSPLEGIQGPTLGQTHRTQAYMSTYKKRRCLSGREPLRDLTSILGTLGGRKVHHPDPRGAAVMRCREPRTAVEQRSQSAGTETLLLDVHTSPTLGSVDIPLIRKMASI